MYGLIYKAVNLINGKIYIGLTTQTLTKRISQHKSYANNNKCNILFHKAIKKYGFVNFSWEIIDNDEDFKSLKEKEKYWIEFYNSYVGLDNHNGYNLTIGGEGRAGFKVSDKTREKMRKGRVGIKVSNATKERMSESKKGINNSNSKLNVEKAKEIMKLLDDGMKVKDVQKKYNISPKTVYDIRNTRSWCGYSLGGECIEDINMRNSKLILEEAKEIVRLYDDGMTIKELMNLFNVSQSTISRIKNTRKWNGYELE